VSDDLPPVVYHTLGSDVYHTDAECRYIGDTARTKRPEEFPIAWYDECAACSGDYHPGGDNGWGGISKLERILNEREDDDA
jgi:hypothetical protein